MNRAIQLGANALGTAAPNPMVGAVIVYKNRILGEGYTSRYGGPHAEVNAIAAVASKDLLPETTLYVTLEPCNHFGKTPPCTDLILKQGIRQVVVGTLDPHEKVSGSGIKKLVEAGCQVQTGILEDACREHHRRFLCAHEKKRPYIILKWAQSKDGYLAPEQKKRAETAQPFWLSNRRCRQLVHQWRSQEQAILVGGTTVVHDNPKLDVRYWNGRSPLRLILDPKLTAVGDYHVFDHAVETVIFTGIKDTTRYIKGQTYELLDRKQPLAGQICRRLADKNVQSLIVEGGAKTLQTFLDEGLWDEARIFSGAAFLGRGLKAPTLSGRPIHSSVIGDTSLNILRND